MLKKLMIIGGLAFGLSATAFQAQAEDLNTILPNGYVHLASRRGVQISRLTAPECGAQVGDYKFTNQGGNHAFFRQVGPYKLHEVATSGGWDSNIDVTVIRTEDQVIIWFSLPGGYHDRWVRPR